MKGARAYRAQHHGAQNGEDHRADRGVIPRFYTQHCRRGRVKRFCPRTAARRSSSSSTKKKNREFALWISSGSAEFPRWLCGFPRWSAWIPRGPGGFRQGATRSSPSWAECKQTSAEPPKTTPKTPETPENDQKRLRGAWWWMSYLDIAQWFGLPYVYASQRRAGPMKRCVADTKAIGHLCMVSVQGFEPPRPPI